MIGRLHHVIIDCPDPPALAAFYSELLGLPVTWQEADFAVVARNDTASGIAFQLDVMVDDVVAAEPQVLALGARLLQGGDGLRIYADPAGHPFCLIPRPAWAPPIGAGMAAGRGGSGGAGGG